MHVTIEEIRAEADDDFGRVLNLDQAAATVSVTRRTINRWIAAGHLRTLPGGQHVLEAHVRDCEHDRYEASRQGRPGPRVQRVQLDVLT
jgi:hypothetical protein